MSGGSSEGASASDALPADASATEALENAVEESRREYDKKVETMEEIDDKAMRSVRTAVILVGLVVSAVSVGGPGAVAEIALLPAVLGALGVLGLTVSIVSGIGVYSVTEYPTGVGSVHRVDVVTGDYSHEEWLVNLLDEYDEWSDRITEELAANLYYLEFVRSFLSFGVLSLLASASMIISKVAYGIQPFVTFAVVVASLVVSRTYLGDSD